MGRKIKDSKRRWKSNKIFNNNSNSGRLTNCDLYEIQFRVIVDSSALVKVSTGHRTL